MHPSIKPSRTLGVGLTGVALAALAIANAAAARQAERRHPPKGSFVTVDGVRLHYTDRGKGSPILLLHGNAVSEDDFCASGLTDLLVRTHRVIAFDRPGFGHSQRGRIWTAEAQADVIHQALDRLHIQRPVVVGHSYGTIVALSLAARHPGDAAGLVLLSGYYFGTLRPDVALVIPAVVPFLGDVLRYTVLPIFGRMAMPLLKRAMFAPSAMTPRFRADYSESMALRPSQIRASSLDGAFMIPSVRALRHRYADLRLPVSIIAGSGDKIVFPRMAKRLQAGIPGSRLHVIEGTGHMVHHTATREVAVAIEAVARKASLGAVTDPSPELRGRQAAQSSREHAIAD